MSTVICPRCGGPASQPFGAIYCLRCDAPTPTTPARREYWVVCHAGLLDHVGRPVEFSAIPDRGRAREEVCRCRLAGRQVYLWRAVIENPVESPCEDGEILVRGSLVDAEREEVMVARYRAVRTAYQLMKVELAILAQEPHVHRYVMLPSGPVCSFCHAPRPT